MDIKIEKLTVSATARTLSAKWRLVEVRWDFPKHLKLSDFPHKVEVYSSDIHALKAWCNTHVGELDVAWTYRDASEFRFRDLDAAIQFALTLHDEASS
jgi:hypothetical protein